MPFTDSKARLSNFLRGGINDVGFISPIVYRSVVPTERREITSVDIETSVTPLGESSLVKEAANLMTSA